MNRPAHMAPPVPLSLDVASGPRYIQKYTLGAWGEVKQCAAASGRKRNATEAELIQQDRAAQAAPVPERNAGGHTVAAVISKREQGNSKCILWESTAGELLNNECTWEQAAFDIVAMDVASEKSAHRLVSCRKFLHHFLIALLSSHFFTTFDCRARFMS